jgi:predicted component of type VI protein secretion system
MIVRFVVVEPESKKGSHMVRLPLLVGRSRESKFRIQQERVSRRHCQFTVEDGVVFVRDLGSTNGTHLGGRPVPVDPPTRVPPGALIQVGSLGFLVQYDALAETPTVDLRDVRFADALTIGPAGDGTDDVDICFGANDASPVRRAAADRGLTGPGVAPDKGDTPQAGSRADGEDH